MSFIIVIDYKTDEKLLSAFNLPYRILLIELNDPTPRSHYVKCDYYQYKIYSLLIRGVRLSLT